MQTLLPPVDVTALDGEIGTWLHDTMHDGLATGVDGWLDDDLAFLADWGFEPPAVEVPTLVVAGGQDLMVPVSHGHWLADRLPGDADVQDDEGHLSLLRGIDRVQGWLAERAAR
ncbi:hypothetical protein GCM10025868_40220 [Angustibacter aerolatus]|uniref:AB hydrolase-1 domain-containing protein n=1 Tax=Angustibacter aerolatus TaxID=1162965 RepID=A0ABQ6JPK4_9ACTN|nr:hypothetical protein GCM10025868_40220 [Angustibacter aerolatus]